MMHGQKNIKLS